MGRRRSTVIGISLLMLVAGILVVGAALAGLGSKNSSLPPPKTSFVEPQAATAVPIPEKTPTPEPQPTAEPSKAPIAEVKIPKIRVNGGIEVLGLTKDNAMQDPKGYFTIGWYNFSPLPGWGGNAIFAGHVDCANCGPGGRAGPAVFWDLNKLERDDEISIALGDGTNYSYRIVSMFVVTPRDDGNFDTSVGTVVSLLDLIGPTEQESITLITCGGTFNARTHEYDKRLIVRAERQPSPSARAQ